MSWLLSKIWVSGVGIGAVVLLAWCSLEWFQERVNNIVASVWERDQARSGGQTVQDDIGEAVELTRELIVERYDMALWFLDLHGLNLRETPELCEILTPAEQEALLSVDLSSNQIEKVDTDWSCLTYLQEADFSFNNIIEFTGIGDVPVVAINMTKNKLAEWGGIVRYRTLQRLDAWFNNLMDTAGIEQLPNLRELYLHHNLLESLSWVTELVNLQQLSVEFNKLTDQSRMHNIQDRLQVMIRGASMADAATDEWPVELDERFLYQPDPNQPEFIWEE